jgi:hypothetical protein
MVLLLQGFCGFTIVSGQSRDAINCFLVILQKGEECCIQLDGKLRDRHGGGVLEWMDDEGEQRRGTLPDG